MFTILNKFDVFFKLNQFNLYFLIIFFFFFFLILVVGYFFNFWKIESNLILFKNATLFVFSLSFVIFLFYFFVVIHFKSILLIKHFIYNDYKYYPEFTFDTSSLLIIYLCYLIGFISIITLGDRFFGANYLLSILFIFFIIIINLLSTSNSLFELFIYYELLLLPSVLFVHKSGYTRKSHQANIFFFIWTQLGSLIVLLGILWISNICGTTEFIFIKNFIFKKDELFFLYLIFFFGFGVKVPVWPLHFWLIKVHVEAPSGFSIFLSGFLVKSAVYCFYKIIILLNIKTYSLIPIFFCIFGMLDSSLKMWVQVDIKKLIAFATVQEMNAIFLLFNLGDSWAINAGLIFLLAHGVLSSLMFFLIECIYKRLQTRSLYKIYGISHLYPNLSLSIWAMLILFFGFPGTLKFYVEMQLAIFLSYNDLILTFFILLIFIFVNTIGFARCWFSVLYGHPGYDHNNPAELLKIDLTTEEIIIISLLVFLSITPCFFIFVLY